MKRETHACNSTTRAFFYLAYESSQVRPPLRFHGLSVFFDLVAGSVALEILGEYTLAEATEGKKHAEIHEVRQHGSRCKMSERNK